MRRTTSLLTLACALAACRQGSTSALGTTSLDTGPRLPTGRVLDPAGTAMPVGSMPLALTVSPDGRQLVVLLNGYREQGVQVVDRATGRITQTLLQAAAFLGVAFSPDGSTLYASGGNQDVVYRYAWHDGRATLTDSLVLAPKSGHNGGTRYPGGLAPSPDGRFLYVAENLADSLAVIDLGSARVVQRFATERWPYAVAVAKSGAVYVSAWGGSTVSTFTPGGAALTAGPRIRVGRHPSALLLNDAGSRLFVASGSTDRVAVVDTRTRRVVDEILDTPPGGPGEGSTPNGLALSADGTRLFIAEADNNAIAIADLTPAASGVATALGDDRVKGRVPTQWYPTAVLARGDSLVALTGKGAGTSPNRAGPQPDRGRNDAGFDQHQYTLGQTSGSIVTSLAARASGAELDALTARVARANRWGEARIEPKLPPFDHVIYIIKENRTYDQVLGDLPQADGDTALTFFPRSNAPNHHALAERFGIFDRFFVNAEASPDGHNWSTAAYTTDYLQKTVPSNYSGRGRTYDWEGTNRGRLPVDDDDVNEPANGYLWNLAQRAGITFRNYGEFVIPANAAPGDPEPAGYRGNKPFLRAHTNPEYPSFDLEIRDQRRADVWLADLARFTAANEMPALQLLRLPNDHTSGAKAGAPTPRAQVADNDLALGRIIEALSKSPFWRSTVVFVLEDDAQNGPDHVDSHRSPMFIISAWNRPGVYHRFANTTDVLATIERVLKLGTLSQFDHFGHPIVEPFGDTPDLRPYQHLTSALSLDEKNPAGTREARESAQLDLRIEDVADEALFNRVLWRTIKGPQVPYPGPRRVSTLELARTR
ncbi:MAG: beta-propeller fold lactonase family protein [Gemmatimonadetes bacterium]|nr:beta-propeller fold lactonase family protein [Gemmatimonadota bacterium]MBI3504511.1 beta-propeller fold lactonase family protein [Pseudomonadota bacterium]